MPDSQHARPPGLSKAELAALRATAALAAPYAKAGRAFADSMRRDLSELDDLTLGRIALRYVSYLILASRSQPGITAAEMANAFSAAAAELTDLETGRLPEL